VAADRLPFPIDAPTATEVPDDAEDESDLGLLFADDLAIGAVDGDAAVRAAAVGDPTDAPAVAAEDGDGSDMDTDPVDDRDDGADAPLD
jgi:hypothetical protein